MNKKLLVLAIAAAATATSASAANVYKDGTTTLDVGGRAEFRGDFIGTDSGDEIDGTMHNASRFRLNVGGETQITDGLTGFGFYEAEQGVKSSGDNDASSDFTQRYMFAGLGTKFGDVSFGRQDTATVMISQMSDISTYSGGQKGFITAGDEQINNAILYTGNFLNDALVVKADVVLGDSDNTDGYGVAAKYTLPMGLGFALGYAANEGDSSNATSAGDDEYQIIGGVNYTNEHLYLGATYTGGETASIDRLMIGNDAVDFQGVEATGQYKFDNQFRVIATYSYQEVDDEDYQNWAELTGGYDFTNNLYAYMSYRFNLLDEDSAFAGVDEEDSVRLGLLYQF
ncbi:porin [Vibrio sp. CK2-1]|uniref:porin n=1 Tax=Vibrio sp. CK2-1 TaxID=2912249 RepID=UPI001F018434|nr:porin [Vibrio sp. CK2-1]MCF7353980.1 porin [Vibrio sp. CK2-1]